MRRQVQGFSVRQISRSAAFVTGLAAVVASGCVRNRPQPGLLGPRVVVPAPYVEPATPAPATALPPEPVFNATPVVPAGVTLNENLIQPVPASEPVAKAKTWEPPAKVDSERLTYTVKKGDSLWLVGQMYGVSVAELTAENDISPSKVLKIGQVLTLPAGARLRDAAEIKRATAKRPAAPAARTSHKSSTPKPAAATTPKSHGTAASSSPRKAVAKEPIPADGMYTIKSGDNPWDIARKFGVKHEELMQMNNLKSDTVLQVGNKLRLRSGTAEAAPATATATAVAPDVTPAAGAVLPEATPLAAPGTTQVPATGAETPVTVPAVPAAGVTAAPDVAPPAALTPATPEAPKADAGAAVTPAAPGTLPAIAPGTIDLPKKLSHTVTDGETLQIIAEMYGTTVDAIKKENPTIKGDADLQANMKLMVPYR